MHDFKNLHDADNFLGDPAEEIGDPNGQWTPFSKRTFAVLIASPPLTPASVIFNMAFAFVI